LQVVRRPRLVRWAPIAGIGYAALVVAAGVLTARGPCGWVCFARTEDAEVIAFYESSGNRARVAAAYFLFGVAIACFLWFLTRLSIVVREADRGEGTLSGLVVAGGVVYVSLLAAGIAIYAAVATGPGVVTDEEFVRIDPDVVRTAGDAYWMVRSLGGVGAATLAFASAAAVRALGRRRLGVLGYVLGALTLVLSLQEGTLDRGVAITFGLQDVAFLAWVVVLSSTLLRPVEPLA
jgi:hypothetical protein